SGANQTVDQVRMYGDHVLWSVDVALPEAQPPMLAIRNLRTLANRAYAIAAGHPSGAVHLNFPFRKPLEPTPAAGDLTEAADMRDAGLPHTRFWRATMPPAREMIDWLGAVLYHA